MVTGKKCETTLMPRKDTFLKRSVSISKTRLPDSQTGASSQAFASRMVASTTLMFCMRLVLALVRMSSGCGSVVIIRMSASATIRTLVFVFSHRYLLLWYIDLFPDEFQFWMDFLMRCDEIMCFFRCEKLCTRNLFTDSDVCVSGKFEYSEILL